jgi:peptidoglycan LD-endopeptidase CwlK
MTARKWTARSLRNLEGVHPDFRRVMDRALQESPLNFEVIEGLRTVARQKQLVAMGASKTMNSRHITGHAVDLLPIGPDGKGRFDWPLYHKLAPAVKAAAAKEGVALVWGGDWKSFKDGPHFELDRRSYPANAPAPTVTPARVKPAAGGAKTPRPKPKPPGLWAQIRAIFGA